ncbi:MAG: hypothetical protein HYY03_06730 [Chloroflexi bacterium]|nr:hypothetical protein [Chloroflexota bacterium]
MMKRLFLIAGGLLLAGALSACGGGGGGEEGAATDGGGDEGTVVNVTMTETDEAWTYDLDTTAIPAGEVTFKVKNEGKFEHELMVYAAQEMSHLLVEMVEAAEMGMEAGHAEEIEGMVMSVDGEDELELEPGESGEFTVNLSPGTYEIGCLIVETVGTETFTHHEKGMHATLAVQ